MDKIVYVLVTVLAVVLLATSIVAVYISFR